MINIYDTYASSCKIPVTILKNSVSPFSEQTCIFLWIIIIAVTVSLGRPNANSICAIFSLYIESNALEKSTNKSVASRFFACTQNL